MLKASLRQRIKHEHITPWTKIIDKLSTCTSSYTENIAILYETKVYLVRRIHKSAWALVGTYNIGAKQVVYVAFFEPS